MNERALAGSLRGREGVLLAEIDTEDVVRARFDFDRSGHYARPDVFGPCPGLWTRGVFTRRLAA